MTLTYCDKIMSDIRSLDHLQMMECHYLANGLSAIFMNHFYCRFYEIVIKPCYDIKDRKLKTS